MVNKSVAQKKDPNDTDSSDCATTISRYLWRRKSKVMYVEEPPCSHVVELMRTASESIKEREGKCVDRNAAKIK